ncbi:MAG: hypothetical protein KatS3mg126_2458 [Lysobacteraceae bacterium]|nr:MAG: hypothetical protein KatS3mg126_2458 [Xanthomonadaceae bacterium]
MGLRALVVAARLGRGAGDAEGPAQQDAVSDLQRLRFDDRGVEISTTQGTRRLDWTAFSGWIDLGIGWMLLGPRHELPVLRRGLAPAEAERLQALLGAHLVRQERPRR